MAHILEMAQEETVIFGGSFQSTCIFEQTDLLFVFFLERDAFDTLFDHAPEKLTVVKKVQLIAAFFHL